MMARGWAQLHRDLRPRWPRDGLVLDVRENRGGHTSQLVVEKLARTDHRLGPGPRVQPDALPEDARRGPVVAVTDMYAGSDGDIVNAAIQALGSVRSSAPGPGAG